MTEYRIAEVGELPPYDHDELCPKCHFMRATTEYYAAFHNAAGASMHAARCRADGLG